MRASWLMETGTGLSWTTTGVSLGLVPVQPSPVQALGGQSSPTQVPVPVLPGLPLPSTSLGGCGSVEGGVTAGGCTRSATWTLGCLSTWSSTCGVGALLAGGGAAAGAGGGGGAVLGASMIGSALRATRSIFQKE